MNLGVYRGTGFLAEDAARCGSPVTSIAIAVPSLVTSETYTGALRQSASQEHVVSAYGVRHRLRFT